MLACVDVAYREDDGYAALLLFGAFRDARAFDVHLAHVGGVAPYQSGAFYLRELPCVMAVLARVDVPLEVIVIDGHVFLDDAGTPGLGARLHAAIAGAAAIVGVAKTSFRGAPAKPVLRGTSTRPLFVSAIGIEVDAAAEAVRTMHGPHRLPTLLADVDRRARAFAKKDAESRAH
jgi:deoxyribonuclease V